MVLADYAEVVWACAMLGGEALFIEVHFEVPWRLYADDVDRICGLGPDGEVGE